MIGVWDRWNEGEVGPYGLSDTYRLGAEWLRSCALVEDWGCGRGYMRQFFHPTWTIYKGIDGSGPHADVIADLAEYRSDVPGVFMRHVLEHNVRWPTILGNAVASFAERMFLAIFTPVALSTHEIGWNEELGVPDIAFDPREIESYFSGTVWTKEAIKTPTQYGGETVYRITREV